MTKLRTDFDTLVSAHSPELFRYAMGLCHNRDTAEDLVQETFLRAWRARADLRDGSAVRSWLYTILRNEHARLYERQRPDVHDPFELPDVRGLLQEMRTFVAEAAPSNAIFRTNHASNWLPLEGRLPRDRDRIVQVLDAALEGDVPLRPAWARGL